MYTWSLAEGSINVSKAFSALSIGGYGYIHTDGKEYAVLSSYIYEPRNPMSRSRYYTSYDFILNSQPDREYTITSDILSYMVNSGIYEIIPQSDRTIYMTIDVREIYRVDIVIEAMEHDTNSTTRQTRISNGTNNTVVVELNNQASIEDGRYTKRGVIYTYKGLNNSISSSYDERRYSGVEYYISGVKLEGNSVVVEGDSEIVVRYIPKSLEIEVVYELEGEVVSIEEISSILTKFEVTGESEVYLGSKLGIEYTLNTDYNIRIEINGKELSGNEYIVQDIDYESGKVEIVAKVDMQSNEEISIRYVLADSTQSLPTDDIGSMEIYVSGELVEGNEGIRVIEGRRVEVVLALNRGYVYYGYKQNSGAINRDGIEGNRLVISESFDVERDSGEYIIYVSKESIEAILDQSERRQ